MQILYQYEQYLSNYSQRTKEEYLNNIRLYFRYLKEYKGDNELIIYNVNKYDIYNYIAYMDHLSKNTKKVRLYAVKNFYKFLNSNLSNLLFEDIKLFNTDIKIPYYLSLSQCEALMNYYTDKRNKLIINIFLTTGIRLSEILEIKLENIKGDILKIKCKGNRDRHIILSKNTLKLIKEYTDKKEGYLFRLNKRTIQWIVCKALKDLGYKGSTHTLRHTAATIMYQETKDILLVKEFLGHKSIEATQIYTHISNEQVKNAVNSNPLAKWGC